MILTPNSRCIHGKTSATMRMTAINTFRCDTILMRSLLPSILNQISHKHKLPNSSNTIVGFSDGIHGMHNVQKMTDRQWYADKTIPSAQCLRAAVQWTDNDEELAIQSHDCAWKLLS